MGACKTCGANAGLMKSTCPKCATEAAQIHNQQAAYDRQRRIKQQWLDAIQMQKNEFKGITSLLLDIANNVPFAANNGLRLSGNVKVRAQEIWMDASGESLSSLVFTRVGEGWQWLHLSDVDLLVDGEPIHAESSISTDVVTGGTVIEAVSVTLDESLRARLSHASKARIQIGIYAADVPRDTQFCLRLLEERKHELQGQS